jgi:hypothetical protein
MEQVVPCDTNVSQGVEETHNKKNSFFHLVALLALADLNFAVQPTNAPFVAKVQDFALIRRGVLSDNLGQTKREGQISGI